MTCIYILPSLRKRSNITSSKFCNFVILLFSYLCYARNCEPGGLNDDIIIELPPPPCHQLSKYWTDYPPPPPHTHTSQNNDLKSEIVHLFSKIDIVSYVPAHLHRLFNSSSNWYSGRSCSLSYLSSLVEALALGFAY